MFSRKLSKEMGCDGVWRQAYECKRGKKGCFGDEKTEVMILKELREKVRQDCDGEGDAGKRGEAASRTGREGRLRPRSGGRVRRNSGCGPSTALRVCEGGGPELAISNILGHKISRVTEACQANSEDQVVEIRT